MRTIGPVEYEVKLDLIKSLSEKEGLFHAIYGDIDRRTEMYKDKQLQEGFKIECGVKGSKLSGG